MYRHQSRGLNRALIFLCCLLGISVFTPKAEAAKITKVKGAQALIDLEGEGSQYAEGNRYIVMVDGKRRAVVEIAKVKGDKAIGKILKGTASEGGTLVPLSGGSAKSAPRSSRSHSRGGNPLSALSWGGLVNYGSTGQTVTPAGGLPSYTMSGSMLGAKAFGDYPINGPLGVIGRFGFENFGVTGSDSAGVSHKTSILYVSGDLLLRYHFLEGAFHPFPVAGLGLFFPLSKSSDALDLTKLGATTIIFIGGGVDYVFSSTMYFRVMAEYGYFPVQSADVKTSLLEVRAGVGIPF